MVGAATPGYRALLPGALLAEPYPEARGPVRRTARDWVVDVLLFLFAAGLALVLGAYSFERGIDEGQTTLDLAVGLLCCLGLWVRRRIGRIPDLREGDPEEWLPHKREVLVLGVRKGFDVRPNGRSGRLHRAVVSNGCAMACAYCYVPRRKGFANPITTFVNIEEIARAIADTPAGWARSRSRTRSTRAYWVYDIGENGDCSVDALIGDNVQDLVALFRGLPNAKASFATKYVNRDLLDYDPRGKTRIRFSLMPQRSPSSSTSGPRRWPSGSPPSTTSSRPATRSTSTSARVVYTRAGSSDYARCSREVDDALSGGGQGAARGGGHLPDAQRPAARGQPRLAPEGRGAAVGAGPPGGEGLGDRRPRTSATGGG